MKRTIHQHIDDNIKELDSNCSKQRKRHLEFETDQLINYLKAHPNEDKDPTSLELFCNENPDSVECRIYE